ncbi:hypothetical protein K438DRAFT_1980936 [Mycena galopus ATCC 62051]|nr:hypothetical protein K438DRAFT_1980936 [Mycena galopus ATCC 62051]
MHKDLKLLLSHSSNLENPRPPASNVLKLASSLLYSFKLKLVESHLSAQGWSQFGYVVALGTLQDQRGLDNREFGPHRQVTAASPRFHHDLPYTRGTLSALAVFPSISLAPAPSAHIPATLACAKTPAFIHTVMLPRSLYLCRTDIPLTANQDRSIYHCHITALQRSEDNTPPHKILDNILVACTIWAGAAQPIVANTSALSSDDIKAA